MPIYYFIVGYIGSIIYLSIFNFILRKLKGFKIEIPSIENKENIVE